MSEQQPPASGLQPPAPTYPAPAPPAVLPQGGSSSLADGEWHRMHPLTPLFKGGLVLLVVGAFVITNLRDRVIGWFVDLFAPDGADVDMSGGDPVDWVLENNFILLALLGTLALLIIFVVGFWLIWRFQQFRITGDHVEVRKGIVFRSHRRAPLDRVQGVNLTRPFPARLFGLAKLEVVGAGTDANVDLEYLSIPLAESVRADILRLASGARAARQQGAPGTAGPTTARGRLVSSMNAGVTGLIEGVDIADVEPESLVKIPTGRLVGSQLVSAAVWVIIFAVVFAAVLITMFVASDAADEPLAGLAITGVALAMGIPLILTTVAVTWAQISRSLRYSIAATPDGVRITYGLFTTVTETLPPGRIFAVEVSQSLLWRPFGWWTIKINRMSGKSAVEQSSGTAQQFNIVLPVGKRADVERVLAVILPDAPIADLPLVWEHGILGPVEGDPYKTMPRRAWWRRPLSWRRHGYALSEFGLLLRRGVVWRKLAIFPLARLQGVSISQGPIDRAQNVAEGQAHTVPGPVTGTVSGIERQDAIALLEGATAAAVLAASRDHTHRWGEWLADAEPAAAPIVAAVDGAGSGAGAGVVPAPLAPPAPPAPGTTGAPLPPPPGLGDAATAAPPVPSAPPAPAAPHAPSAPAAPSAPSAPAQEPEA